MTNWKQLAIDLLNNLQHHRDCDIMNCTCGYHSLHRRAEVALDDPDNLDQIKDIINSVENRAMAVDGPVTNTRHEMTDDELRQIYVLAGGKVH